MTSINEKSQTNFDLSMPVQYLKGVGPARAKTFAQLGVHTVGDLLEHFPRDWNFAPEAIKIAQTQPDQTVTIVGLVESIDYQSFRRPPIFEAIISDDPRLLLGERLRQFDALVMNNIHEREPFLPEDFARLNGEQKTAAQKFDKAVKQSILEYVRSGKGIVGIHAATAAFGNWSEYGDMMGAAMATNIQKRMMTTPIVALRERRRSAIVVRRRTPRGDPRRVRRSISPCSCVSEVGDFVGNNEFELSLMVRTPVQSPITQIECVDS